MTESQLVTSCLRYLQVCENLGKIVHCDRLNSGKVFTKHRRVTLCRAGTPDAYFIRNNGVMIWLEMKVGKNKLTAHQEEFRAKVENAGHFFYVIRSTQELEKLIESN